MRLFAKPRWIGTLVWVGSLFVALAPDVASAQISDRLSERRLRRANTLYQTWAYRNDKDEEARYEGSSWAALGGIGGGYDSNIFENRNDEQGSAIVDGILQLEHLRYFGDRDRLRLIGIFTARGHTESSNPDQLLTWAFASWRHEYSDDLRFGFRAGFKYENDNVVNSEGFSPTRDFEHVQFEARPQGSYRIDESQRIFGAYRARYRDYVGTRGLPSLNFWFHGPTVIYEVDPTRKTRIQLTYAFRQEIYDSNPARTASGDDAPRGRPEEEHFFHRARIEGMLRPLRNFDTRLAVEYERKDDRFEDFESYDSFFVWSRTRWAPGRSWTLTLTAAYERRSFDERPRFASGTPGGRGSLRFDRFFVSPAIRYDWDERIALFAYHTLTVRNTNRDFGNDFRDLTIHRVLAGVSFAL